MSLNLPARRLLSSTSCCRAPASRRHILLVPSTFSNLHNGSGRRGIKTKSSVENSPMEAALRKQTGRKALLERFSRVNTSSSIFADELNAAKAESADSPESVEGERPLSNANKTRAGGSLDALHLARAVDPDPRSRVRWERKMVIRSVRNATSVYAREPKAAFLKRTERSLRSRSSFLPTSIKKLVHLARQIQGKTVDEALVQMRFSKKKMAREVSVQLRQARDLAIVERGMGLGEPSGETERWRKEVLSSNSSGSHTVESDGAVSGARVAKPLLVVDGKNGNKAVKIRTKDGRWHKVDDPTTLYVDEAWVGKGPWRAKVPEYRARSQVNILHRPSTSITVVLKEEKTRIREYKEREAKKARHGPWVHLPNRPVTAQRQHYSW